MELKMKAQQRLWLNFVIPYKGILVARRQINRKHDIPVCLSQEAVDLLCPEGGHVFSDTGGLP